MKFGPVAPSDALGATAVHSIRQGDLVLKKGTLIGSAEVAARVAAARNIQRERYQRLGQEEISCAVSHLKCNTH